MKSTFVRAIVLTLTVAGFAQTPAKRHHEKCILVGRTVMQEPNHRHRLLLRAPRAAKQPPPPPSSLMKSRLFTDRCLPCFRRKG